MNGDGRDEDAALPELHALDAAARRAVSAARSEAQALRHDRIGTEHLLLGLLADEASAAARVLMDAGAGPAIVRNKVLEAKPGAQAPMTEAPSEATARAARAVRRSLRFSHQRQTKAVTPEDLLIGVLDVEGTAGQVLRSLGIDVEDLREALGGDGRAGADDRSRAEPATARATCPGCGSTVTGDLVAHRARARSEDGKYDVLVVCCPACGAVLGVTRA